MQSGSHTASEFSRKIHSPFAAAKPMLLPRANPSFFGFRTIDEPARRSGVRPASSGAVSGGVVDEDDFERRPGLREERRERVLQHRAAIPVDDDGADERRVHALAAGVVAPGTAFRLTTTNSL